MNNLITKARSGVTLVELLVVILIVTILSVSMLPLLQPFVTESQYAAEAIPVIGNIRTKVGLYVYDKGHLPTATNVLGVAKEVIETWVESDAKPDVYVPAYYTYGAETGPEAATKDARTPIDNVDLMAGHIQIMLDIDYQDLKGKRSRPLHYQYYALNVDTSSYVLGCFGDGNGLKAGTGYAVCELNFPEANRKVIGTWKRYKSYTGDSGAIIFSSNNTPNEDTGKVPNCYVPTYEEMKAATDSDTVQTTIIEPMMAAGWEF